MAERFARIYEEEPKGRWPGRLISDLLAIGLGFEDPRTGYVFEIDEEGDQVRTDEKTLKTRLETAIDSVQFQLWFREMEDLYFRVRFKGPCRIIEIGMEGSSRAERETLRGVFMQYCETVSQAGNAIGIIFDPEGWSEDYDWDGLFGKFFGTEQGRRELPERGTFPELLIIANPDPSEMHDSSFAARSSAK